MPPGALFMRLDTLPVWLGARLPRDTLFPNKSRRIHAQSGAFFLCATHPFFPLA